MSTQWGCTDSTACNYYLYATIDDGSCEFKSCIGCLNVAAVTMTQLLFTSDDCEWPEEGYGGGGICLEMRMEMEFVMTTRLMVVLMPQQLTTTRMQLTMMVAVSNS